jgi:hypothetical protein
MTKKSVSQYLTVQAVYCQSVFLNKKIFKTRLFDYQIASTVAVLPLNIMQLNIKRDFCKFF